MRKLQFALVGVVGVLVGHITTLVHDERARTIVVFGNDGCELNLAGGGGLTFWPRATDAFIKLNCSEQGQYWGHELRCHCKRRPNPPETRQSVQPNSF